MKSNKQTETKIEKIYKKMGLVEVSTKEQVSNGTRSFFDTDANCNFVFRQFSAPRVEYFSPKTNSVQSYKMFEPNGANVREDMQEAIPYIVNRKIKGVRERAKIAMNLATRLF
jgi:hypothetical protein